VSCPHKVSLSAISAYWVRLVRRLFVKHTTHSAWESTAPPFTGLNLLSPAHLCQGLPVHEVLGQRP